MRHPDSRPSKGCPCRRPWHQWTGLTLFWVLTLGGSGECEGWERWETRHGYGGMTGICNLRLSALKLPTESGEGMFTVEPLSEIPFLDMGKSEVQGNISSGLLSPSHSFQLDFSFLKRYHSFFIFQCWLFNDLWSLESQTLRWGLKKCLLKGWMERQN